MKICILTSSYPGQGGPVVSAALFLPGFIEALKRLGHEVFVITSKYEEADFSGSPAPVYFFEHAFGERALNDLKPNAFFDIFKILFFLLTGFFHTLKIVKKQKPDHVLVCWAIPFGIYAWLIKKLFKTPYSVWSLGSDVWKADSYPLGMKVIKTVFRGSKNNFSDGFNLSNRVTEISGRECFFMPTVRYININEVPGTVLDKRKVNFLFIGRYHKDKGPDLLIQAFRYLTKKNQQVFLHMFGMGHMRDELASMIRKYDLEQYIALKGFANETQIVSYIKSVDCVIIPSRFDSIPLVFSEAIQGHRPMVVTDVGDTGALVRKYRLGFVAVAGNAEDLGQKLEEFLSSFSQGDLNPDFFGAMELFDIRNSAKLFVKYIL